MTHSHDKGLPVERSERLRLDPIREEDAPLVLRVLDDAEFRRFVADRGVRTEEDARRYLREGPLAIAAREGFGLWRVSHRDDGRGIGVASILRRDEYEHPDLGYAIVAEERGRGFATEAGAAAMRIARERLGLGPLLAIVQVDNLASVRVVEKLGFRLERRAGRILVFLSDPARDA
ncbi:MAG: GNAT family N-acetyltransferase [Planctomycetota bacterium]